MPNIRHAFRALFKSPFVTTIAVLSLALGIGATAAIYSLFDQILLRPLPVAEPERLVNLSAPGPMPGSNSCNQAGDCESVFSYAMFRDLEKANTAFSGVAAHRLFGANIAYKTQTVSGEGVFVSGSYFPVLGIRAALGRLFTPNDDRVIGQHFVAVLSYPFWQTKLGGDRTVIDQKIVVNGQTLTVIGVAPEGFEGTTLGATPSVFVPITMYAALTPGWSGFEDRRRYWIYLFARLKPSVTMDQAKLAANAVFHPIINDVEVPLQKGVSAQTLTKFRARQLLVEDGRRGQSDVRKEARASLVMLFAITGIVLLIACANIANLLLARAANRSSEIAVRLSIGATRWQVLGQLLMESCLLALIGGVVSILVAHWTLAALLVALPAEVATTLHFQLHWNVVAFAGLLALGTGVLFGLFPALQSTNPDLVNTLREGSGKLAGTRSTARFRNGLVVGQIALSMALLVASGLFVKSLMNVTRVDLGIKTSNLVTFSISPVLNGYSGPRSALLFQRMEREIGAIPGVVGVTEGRVALVAGNNWGTDVNVQGFTKGPDVDANSRYNAVGAGWLHTIGIQLVSGRDFTVGDGLGAARVAIVNESFAKKFGLGKDAVGKFMGANGNDSLVIQIVGLAKDAAYSEVKQAVPPVFVVPYRQDSTIGSLNFYVRTGGDPASVLHAIPAIVKKLDPNLPVDGLKTFQQQVKDNVFMDRMISTLSASFAVLATMLAAVGLYGVLAYSVAQRTREIGVRMALGADAARVRWMVMRQVGVLTLTGSLIGLLGAVALGRGAESLLFGLKGQDTLVTATAAAILLLVAAAAGYQPARNASRVDPMQALRYE